MKNAKALGYIEQEVRAAQDLVNEIVAKANEQKAAAEQALTVITAAYDAIAGKYGDGDVRKKSLLEKYGEGLLEKIQDKVDGLLK